MDINQKKKEWQALGYLTKAGKSKSFTLLGRYFHVNWSNNSMWETLDSAGFVNRHYFSLNSIHKIECGGGVVFAKRVVLGKLAIMWYKL